jgi:hypothetical protein
MRIFESQNGEVADGRRLLHNEKFRNLCASPHVTRMMMIVKDNVMGQVCSLHERNEFKILENKHNGKKLGSSSY